MRILDRFNGTPRLFAPTSRRTSAPIKGAFLFAALLTAAFGALADLADIYESDGTLGDLAVKTGESIQINTGATPPTLLVSAAPVGYLYQGRVVDGVAVFDFANVTIAEGVATTVTGSRPLAL
ncbi:MAG TPA: hypothetical protein PKV69_08650, partial [Candidatus Hydrogenedentes bacterium]|nr:hypothetical protein [Candidatus Hydrogenedentota bacterium]